MQSSQQLEQRYQLSGVQIQTYIKKKPYTQIIQGVEFTYSMLSKIQKRFFLTNDRFLILKGIQSIGYARNLSLKTPLPFKHQTEIPKPKLVYALSAIQSVTTQNQILKIEFSFDKKALWEFVCPSKVCALQWRKIIQGAIQKMKTFNNRKYQKYQNYPKQTIVKKNEPSPSKQININKPVQNSPEKNIKINTNQKSSPELIRNESLDSLMLNQNQQKVLNKSKSDLGVNTNEIVLVKTSDNSEREIIQGIQRGNFSKKKEESVSFEKNQNTWNVGNQNIRHFPFESEPIPISSVFKNSSPQHHHKNVAQIKNSPSSPTPITQKSFNINDQMRPNKAQMPQQLSKIQSIFLEQSLFESPSQTFLNKSFSTMSMNGKQQVRSQILAYRRQWNDQLVARVEEGELMLDFKKYSKKIVEVLINQLHIPNQTRIFPQKEWSADFASYIVDDVYVEIYFFTEEQIDEKHKRYQKAVKQFKNFDYFLETTQNQYNIYVPLMSIFQFKGFVGMVKTVVGDEKEPYCNHQFFDDFNQIEFEQESRINSSILLNESKCKIISYKKNAFMSKLPTQYKNIYFIERLDSFLPEEKTSEMSKSNRLLRPELIQDDQLDQCIFGQREKDVNGFEILNIIDRKIISLVKHLQDQQQYFTNSQELTELIHSFGLNVRHLGAIYKKISQKWLKLQLKAELAARSIKTLFRFDLQNCILNQIERMNTKEKQSQRQIRRVISFLNVVFGNGEATYRVWRGINNYSSKHYGSVIWQEAFNDVNIGYFLQAIQYHLKIVLNDSIHQKVYFQSTKPFEEKDFLRFQPDITIYNLDFTETFQEINQCLEEVDMENFQDLCRIMIKQTRSKKTYIEILKGQPIYEKINEYLLNFISPQDNIDFYNKLETAHMPKRFIYESKLAQIKWHLKVNKLQALNKIINFIETDGKKWLGPNHPLFVQLNRILAQYYCQHKLYYMKAIALATSSLQMQSILFGSDQQPLWKDYFLLAKIYYIHEHFQQALPSLTKAKKLINIKNESSLENFAQLFIYLSKCYQVLRMNKQSYLNTRQLYNALKEQESEQYLEYLLESVLMIKDLLEKNQQFESYYRFIQTDFSHVMIYFVNDTQLLKQTIRTIFLPYIKSIIFQKSKNRQKALALLQQISKLTQSTFACTSYLQQKIRQKKFPYFYLQVLKDFDSVVDEIYDNQLIQKWISFHRLSNDTLLQRITGNQINRGFQFLADLSAVIGILGNEALGQLYLIQK